jgi:hypothetical protein
MGAETGPDRGQLDGLADAYEAARAGVSRPGGRAALDAARRALWGALHARRGEPVWERGPWRYVACKEEGELFRLDCRPPLPCLGRLPRPSRATFGQGVQGSRGKRIRRKTGGL